LKIILHRVRINQGGYDDKGRYWGASDIPLYFYMYDIGQVTVSDHLRASNREIAKDKVSREIRLRSRDSFSFFK